MERALGYKTGHVGPIVALSVWLWASAYFSVKIWLKNIYVHILYLLEGRYATPRFSGPLGGIICVGRQHPKWKQTPQIPHLLPLLPHLSDRWTDIQLAGEGGTRQSETSPAGTQQIHQSGLTCSPFLLRSLPITQSRVSKTGLSSFYKQPYSCK